LVQISLARFFWFWLGFLGFSSVFPVLAQFFSVWLGFGSVFSVLLGFGSVFFPVSVRFFWFFSYKTEIEPVDVFKILIGFFFGSVFFSGFLSLIGFSVFLLTPSPQAHIEHELNLLRLVLLGCCFFVFHIDPYILPKLIKSFLELLCHSPNY